MYTRRKGKMPAVFMTGVFLIFIAACLVFDQVKAVRAALADHVVVNEIQINSGAGGADYDDWVELYNPTAADYDLSGWSIQKTNSSGASLYRKALTGVIPAQGYFLIVRDHASTTRSLISLANVLAAASSFSLIDNNVIYLVNDNSDITGKDDLNIVDYVGFGTASIYEGSAPAPAIPVGKSITRKTSGQDTNDNFNDFNVSDNPTPKSGASSGDNIGGTVLLTITPDASPAQNITSTGAQIVFQVNAAGTALIKYGIDSSYASSTAPEAVQANLTKTISLSGLACAKTYHYAIYAENSADTENDTTEDAVFTTLPCGIKVEILAMTKSTAKANNKFTDGWQWEFNITVWNMNETSLKMKFDQWSGAGALDAGNNMQYSVDNGAAWRDITANGAYPAAGVDLSGIDNDAGSGRQVKIIVRMKVPIGTITGYYQSSYGILTE